MKDSPNILSIQASILIGSIIIALAILINGGVIKLKGINVSGSTMGVNATPTTSPAVANQGGVPSTPSKVDLSLGHFPIKGSSSADVAVVEFGDMRCPFCKRFFDETESQLIKDYVDSGKVKFAFRQFEFLGSASNVAGNAIECANEQGKFWEYHDYLYKNQPDESDTSMYNTDKLTSVAVNLGLNGDQFRSCLDSSKYSKNMTGDQNDGQQIGVSGTPSFVIGKLDSTGQKIVGGQLIVGAVPYSSIKSSIDPLLK